MTTIGATNPGYLGLYGTLTPKRTVAKGRALEGAVVFSGSISPLALTTTERGLRGTLRHRGTLTPLIATVRYGTFRDFAHYADTMPDPAMVLINDWASGATLDAAAPSQFRRVWLTATPPREYRVSGNRVLWPRAAFMSTGVRVNALANGEYQYVDGGQVEVAPRSQSGPTTYSPARALRVVVRADAMNYVRNPQTASGSLGTGGENARLCNAIPGRFYAAAVTASGTPGSTVRVTLTSNGPTVSSIVGNSGDVTIPFSGSVRIPVPANAPAIDAEVTLHCNVVDTTGSVVFSAMRVDRVSGAGPLGDDRFFTGADGADYLWGGTVNDSESYYYRDRAARTYLLSKVLKENVPLGATPGAPQFAVLPSE